MNKRILKKLLKKNTIISIYAKHDYSEHFNGTDVSFHKYGFAIGGYVYYPYNWIKRVICG